MQVKVGQEGKIAFLLIDNPPINVFTADIRRGLLDGMSGLQEDAEVAAIVVACSGTSFITGADLVEFENGFSEPSYAQCMSALEDSAKPVVVALHGTPMGGGVELALSGHYRTAQPSTKLAMPEITLGVVPGAGGTQRLPRLVGQEKTLDMLLSAAPVGAKEAQAIGLVDDVREGDPLTCGIAFAHELLAAGRGVRPTKSMACDAGSLTDQMVQDAFARHRRALKGRQTQFLIVDALRAAGGDFLKGMAAEKALSDTSLAGRESKALQHAFFSERRSSSIPGLPRDAKALPISRVVVVGAGTMGSGIAMACANAGLKVSLVDSAEQGLDRGRKIIRSAYEADAKRGRLRAASVDDAVGAIQFSLDKGVLATADLVVEAVFENMELKKSVLADIGARVAPGCIIATNTSSLSLSELGQASERPDMVLGLHFFSPAHIMKLLEIVRSDSTSPVTLLTGLEFARRIRKIPVVSGDGFAFIGNRMMLDGAYREGELMLLEGAGVDQLDRAVENFGFAMGPNRVNDMAGVDIGTLVREQLALRETRPDPYSVVSDALTALSRVGQKVGKGFYDYSEDPRSGRLDPAVDELIQTLAAQRGITRRSFDDAEIAERFVLQLINVGAQILEEGIAYRASDIDVVWVHGYGFPRHLGGPMFYADTLGLPHVLDRIKSWQARYRDYWQPSGLLVKLAESGSSFSDYDREQSKAGVCNEPV